MGRVITRMIGITLLLGASAAPANAERLLLPRPITLRGSAPSWETTFAGAGAPRLDLRYEASDLLERGSLLTVMVDGVPRATRPLRPLGRLVVRLGELGEGFHQVTVRARLQVADDPCLREHDDEAWIRIDGATLRGLDEAPAETTVLGWFEERRGSSVVVKAPERPPGDLDPDWAAAILDTHITHWRRGIGHGAESGAIVLEVGPAGGMALAGHVVEHSTNSRAFVSLAARYARKHNVPVVVPAYGPAQPYIARLRAAGAEVEELPGGKAPAACAVLADLVMDGDLHHAGQEVLDEAVHNSLKRWVGDAWVFDRRTDETDVTALWALAAGVWYLDKIDSDDDTKIITEDNVGISA